VRIVERTVIEAPVDRVWAVVSDVEAQADWMADVAWIRRREGDGLGAVFEVRTKVLGVPATTDVIRLTAWEPPHRLAVVHEGFVRGSGEWRLRPSVDGARTLFEWEETLTMPPRGLGEVAIRVYGPVQRAMLRRSMRNLGRLVTAR
jgi:carbon monoxide dehydrogenase subunit G